MKVILQSILILLIAGNVFAADVDTKTQSANNDYVIATIGGQDIYFSEMEREAAGLNRFLKENFEMSQKWRLDFIRQSIARRALAKRAETEGFEKHANVIFALKQAKDNILSDAVLQNRLKDVKITEEDFKKFYEQNKAKYQIKAKIKVSYIVKKNKKDADKIIDQLNKGKSFEKIAGRKKIEVAEWISQDGMPPPGLERIPGEALKELFSLGVGGSSGVVEVEGEMDNPPTGKSVNPPTRQPVTSYYVFHIDQKEPTQDRPFEEVRRQVEFGYKKQVVDSTVNAFILQTFEQEQVRIYEDRIIEGMKKKKE